MADRDITIPMGPDRTGQIDMQPIDFGDGSQSSGSYPAPDQQGAGEAGASVEPVAVPAMDDPGAVEDAPEEFDDRDNVQQSFAALTDSIKQGRELKAREKDLEALGDQVDADREELADREDILANYAAMVAELDARVAHDTQQRDILKAQLADVVAQSEEVSDALARMRDYHDAQLDPYESALGRARANADQAKNDERSRKSELSAAESELRRAGEGNDATVALAKVQQIEVAYNDAKTRTEQANAALAQAQDAYDDLRAEVEKAEAPLERQIEDLEVKNTELKDEISKLGESIAQARKRRAYCDEVYQRPNETAALRADIEQDEATMRQMEADNDDLRARLAESKARSKTAKIAIAAIVVVIIVIIVAFVMVSR